MNARQSRAAEKTEPAREIEPGMPGFKYSGKRMTLTVDFPIEMERYDVGDALNQIAQDIEYRGRTTNRKSEPKFMPKWIFDTNGAPL